MEEGRDGGEKVGDVEMEDVGVARLRD